MTTIEPGQKLTLQQLRNQKRTWYNQACENGSIRSCGLVARTLGYPLNAIYGPKYVWETNGLAIYLDDYGKYMTVTVAGRLVCNTHPTILLFVPGAWMDLIREKATEAEQIVKEADTVRVQKEYDELSNQLGLQDRRGQRGGTTL